MRIVAQLFLDFLLNAIWQVAAIALAAVVGNFLLRSVTRFRHVLWVVALTMSLVVPLLSAIAALKSESAPTITWQNSIDPVIVVPAKIVSSNLPPDPTPVSSGFHVSQRIAIAVLIAFLGLIGYRGARLFTAWIKTRIIRQSARSFEPGEDLCAIVERCQAAFGVGKARILSSHMVKTPATVGVLNPLVILPEELLCESDHEAMTAAVGHELVHVARRDYLLNLICELIFLPLSFHPAAALIKRQITKTRELRCDELVAERLLQPEVYARSLVRLAGWAMPFNRRAPTIVVGIADADILEVRIMSLLKRKHSNLRRAVFGLLLAAGLLAVPCVAAAALAIHFNIDSPLASLDPQEPSREVQEKRELNERQKQEVKERWEKETAELKERIANETNAQIKADLEKALRQREEEKGNAVYTFNGEGYALTGRRNEEGARQERETEARQKTQLARAAKISMDQAIQIATSKTPGKVLECSLVGEHWSGEGELAKPGLVLYHVVILSGDEANAVTNHVLVNAVDGSIFRAEKEERRESSEYLREGHAPIEGGKLNGNAIALPNPEYPDIARAARAEGSVTVQIMIDETGHVVSARAVSGHPLLQAAAVTAARQAVFAPTQLKGHPVKVTGALVYNFVAQ